MKPTILLAEDDALTRFMMCEMLEEMDYDFEVARNGAECHEMIQRSPENYAVVLMDIHMPHKSGVEVARGIRSSRNDPPSNIPIIAITADHVWTDPTRYNQVGFSDAVQKPVNMVELNEKISRVLAA
ncbi:MAG: response regulator [Pseudomonadota bacterium]